MQETVYKCLNKECNAIFHDHRDGLSCPICGEAIAPISDFKDYDNKDISSYKELKDNLSMRIGMLYVSEDLIKKEPEYLIKVFKDVLVVGVSIEYGYQSCIFQYKCISKFFDVINIGEDIPLYSILITKKDGQYKREFTRVDSK